MEHKKEDMEQKAYMILSHGAEIILDQGDIKILIQNISLTSWLRNETSHLRTASPHAHPEIESKDEGIDQQSVQEIHAIPF